MMAWLITPLLLLQTGMPGWPGQGDYGEDLHLLGNSGLTVALDDRGRLVRCYWPAPGYFSHLYAEDQESFPPNWTIVGADFVTLPAYGCAAITQSASQRAPVLSTRYDCGEMEVGQIAFVHPARDLLVLRLEIRGVSAMPMLVWNQGFSPERRRVPHAFLAPEVFEGFNPFYSVIDESIAYQFSLEEGRPTTGSSGRSVWPESRGVWIGLNAGAGGRVMASTSDVPGVVDQPRLRSPISLHVAPSQTGEAWIVDIYIAFADERRRVEEILHEASGKGFSELLQETEQFWDAWFGAGGADQLAGDSLQMARDLQILFLSRNKETGLVMAAPEPRLHFSNTQLAAWSSAAFLAAGYPDVSEHQLRSLGALVAETTSEVLRPGALPALFHTDGLSATPNAIFQAQSTAWWLTALAYHVQRIEPTAGAALLSTLWGAVDRAGAFLAGWSYGPQEDVAPSYEPARRHDTVNMNQRLQVYLGLEAALSIFRRLGEDAPPGLMRRTRELDILIRFHVLNQEAAWPVEAGLAFWFRGILDAEHPLWASRVTTPNFEGLFRDMPLPASDNPEASSAYRAAIRLVAARE